VDVENGFVGVQGHSGMRAAYFRRHLRFVEDASGE
jgi:hypothetical protein